MIAGVNNLDGKNMNKDDQGQVAFNTNFVTQEGARRFEWMDILEGNSDLDQLVVFKKVVFSMRHETRIAFLKFD